MKKEGENLLPPDFDSDFYLNNYPELKEAGVDAEKHYLEFGRQEGRIYKPVAGTPSELDFLLHRNPNTKRPVYAKHGQIWEWVRQNLKKPGLRVLEIGSRSVASDSLWLWKNAIPDCEYTGLDVQKGRNVTIVGDAHRLSEYFAPDFFDLVISFAVFEHLAMPWIVAEEISKVLAPAGHVIIETVFSFSEHELPWHFFQFNANALEVMFCRELGFEVFDSGLDTPIVGRFSEASAPYLRGRLLPDLYAHSSIIAKKSFPRKNPQEPFDWRKLVARLSEESQYPLGSDMEKRGATFVCPEQSYRICEAARGDRDDLVKKGATDIEEDEAEGGAPLTIAEAKPGLAEAAGGDPSALIGKPMNMSAADALALRTSRIVTALDLSGEGIEYGPLNRPTLQKKDCSVRYVDFADRDTLFERYKNNKEFDPHVIPEIDIVTGGKSIDQFVSPNSLDFIVASHVMEHVPDMVGWLKTNLGLLKPNGRLAVAYPDRGYTFDIKRRPAEMSEIIAAHMEKRERPSFAQICDHFFNYADPQVAADIWAGKISKENVPLAYDRKSALSILNSLQVRYNRNEYIDCHCWVFSADELFHALHEIKEIMGLKFNIINFVSTPPGLGEFYFTLGTE